MKRVLMLLALLLVCVTTSSCSKPYITREIRAMDTVMTIKVNGSEKDLDKAERVILDADAKYDATRPGSEIYRLNAGEAFGVSEDTLGLIESAVDMSLRTNGRFDPTVYPLVKAWGFFKGDRAPDRDEIARLLPSVGIGNIVIRDGSVTLLNGAGIDAGGIAKGYTADRVAEALKENGVKSAVISLGGNVHALGTKNDGSLWKIGIRSPASVYGLIGTVSVRDRAVVTSGTYERGITDADGVFYGHILDPETGMPCVTDLASATVIAPCGAEADALSTALYVMGSGEAIRFYRQDPAYDMVLCTNDGRIYVTGGAGFEKDASFEAEVCVISVP